MDNSSLPGTIDLPLCFLPSCHSVEVLLLCPPPSLSQSFDLKTGSGFCPHLLPLDPTVSPTFSTTGLRSSRRLSSTSRVKAFAVHCDLTSGPATPPKLL